MNLEPKNWHLHRIYQRDLNYWEKILANIREYYEPWLDYHGDCSEIDFENGFIESQIYNISRHVEFLKKEIIKNS